MANQQTFGSAAKQFENYIEPNYANGDDYATPAEVRAWFDKMAKELIEIHFGGMRANKVIANPYFFNAHFGQAFRYLDAAKDEFAKAVLAANCKIAE